VIADRHLDAPGGARGARAVHLHGSGAIFGGEPVRLHLRSTLLGAEPVHLHLRHALLGTEPVHHRDRQLDPGDRDAPGGEGQRHPAGADGKLQRSTVTDQSGQKIDRRSEHVATGHGGVVVVASRHGFIEVIREHPPTVA
jgi:hypothetical protein